MSWELHHRESDDKYAIYSTIVDDYNTPWIGIEDLKLWYTGYKCQRLRDDTKAFFENIDKEV